MAMGFQGRSSEVLRRQAQRDGSLGLALSSIIDTPVSWASASAERPFVVAGLHSLRLASWSVAITTPRGIEPDVTKRQSQVSYWDGVAPQKMLT
jgi:hypothetical protein